MNWQWFSLFQQTFYLGIKANLMDLFSPTGKSHPNLQSQIPNTPYFLSSQT